VTETPPRRKRFSLPGIEEFSTQLRSMFINIGFFAATILLIPAVGAQLTRNAVIIDPIAVPPALVKQGLTPEVVANRVWDGLQAFSQSASEARESVVAIPDSQLVEFSLPDAGISIDSIFTQIRQFFGAYDTRLSGEILCATSACDREALRLRLRVVRADSNVVDLPDVGTLSDEDYYREAAAGVFEIIDPYVAIAAQKESSPVRAAALARRLIADGTKDAKWAHNLVAGIELKAGDADRAADDYRSAIALDENFHEARAGLAQALADGGRVDAAREVLADLESRDPRNKLALPILAELTAKENDTEQAIRLLRLATERDPLNPAHLTRAGQIAIAAENRPLGIELLREALSIDPTYEEAPSELTRAYILEGDLDSAEAVFRQWVDYMPDNIDAIVSLANMQLGFDRNAAALANYDRALELDPSNREATAFRALALVRLSRAQEAIAAVLPLTEGAQGDSLALQVLGTAYAQAGETATAIATFERLLAEFPDKPEAASITATIERLKQKLANAAS
jgi:tetratricopeptide (TPR) repeat protein